MRRGGFFMAKRTAKTRTVKRAYLTEALFQKLPDASESATKKFNALAVKDLFLAVNEVLAEGKSLKIYGFGKFALRDKRARKGRNPATNRKMLLPARRVLVFQPSPILNQKLNRVRR